MIRAAAAFRRVLLLSLLATGLGLVAFHGWLLQDSIAAGRLADPVVALKWAGAAAVMLSLLSLRRAGIALVTSRQGVAVWMLVALLHAGGADHLPPLVGDSGPAGATLLFVAPMVSSAVAAGATLLARRAGTRTLRISTPALRALWSLPLTATLPSRGGASLPADGRAPPAFAS